MQQCKKCLLPSGTPGAKLDSTGVCSFCREYGTEHSKQQETQRLVFQTDLEKTLQECRGEGDYDCLVCFSGGKDSVYLLHKLLTEYKLRVLAYTTNFDLPDIAWENIHRTVKVHDVDHFVYTPSLDFYKKFIRHLLMNLEPTGAVHTVCYVMAPLSEGYAIRLAVEKKIPLILTGYSPGQPDADRMVYEMPHQLLAKTDWTPPSIRNNSQFDQTDLSRFWNPLLYPSGTKFPRFIAPFHAWEYSQSEVLAKVVKLGLISDKKHASPIFSNFMLNWLLMYLDLHLLGYNPYAPEFSKLIREGRASRQYWKIAFPLMNFMIKNQLFLAENVKRSLQWLDIDLKDILVASRGYKDQYVT